MLFGIDLFLYFLGNNVSIHCSIFLVNMVFGYILRCLQVLVIHIPTLSRSSMYSSIFMKKPPCLQAYFTKHLFTVKSEPGYAFTFYKTLYIYFKNRLNNSFFHKVEKFGKHFLLKVNFCFRFFRAKKQLCKRKSTVGSHGTPFTIHFGKYKQMLFRVCKLMLRKSAERVKWDVYLAENVSSAI